MTIKEIARICDVSVQTVSRVINGRPDVATQTRDAILKAIEESGYQPSALARSLVQRHSHTLGVIVTGLKQVGVAQMLSGITEASQDAGYALLLMEVRPSDVELSEAFRFLVSHHVDAIIVAAPQIESDPERIARSLPGVRPPLIFLSEPTARATTIGIDNYGGGRAAAAFLLGSGRRRVAHIAGPLDWHEARDRKLGWLDAHAGSGIEPGPVVAGDWSATSGKAAFDQLIKNDPSIDAVFAGNDYMALGALRAASIRGVVVPAEVAVIGFDGVQEGGEFTPSLTTISQPLRELGHLAVQEAIAHVGGDAAHAAPHNVTLPTSLVVRESAPDTHVAAPTPAPHVSGPASVNERLSIEP